MRALVKNSQLCIVPNATHFLLSEKPEIVNPIILEFLNEKR
jgi:pimeloyl-ACP methyl ester carboxylesterase